ncbi:hypothetical protein [Geodermatophilus sp. SYSU D01176]
MYLTRDAQLDEFAAAVRRQWLRPESLWLIGFARCAEEACFAPGEQVHGHLHPETVLTRGEDGSVGSAAVGADGAPRGPARRGRHVGIPELYRTIAVDADGPWADPDVDVWVDVAALSARVG